MSASILVVDDEPDVAELFRQRFRRETRQGTYVLHYAVSGAEALDRLSSEIEPTLIAVLSDINIPGMDGLQLLAEIKQRRTGCGFGNFARRHRQCNQQPRNCGTDRRDDESTNRVFRETEKRSDTQCSN